ncbi:MAG: asparaginase [Lautropia sp.]
MAGGRPRVHVFGLGGTIAMGATAAGGGVVPSLDARMLVDAVPQLEQIAAVGAGSFRQMPGAHLGFDDLEALATAIERAAADGIDGVVVVQGTDTIEETAFALDRLVASPIPVVVTGAMRNPSLPGADGPANLCAAVAVAASEHARGLGCLVAFDDEIHAARFVRKVHTGRVAAFASPQCGPIGWLAEGRVTMPLALRRPPVIARSDAPRAASVALIVLALGDDGTLVRLAAQHGYTGIVVAGVGGGHCTPAAADAIEAAAKQVDVVLATRVLAGEVLAGTYGFTGSEIDLARRGVIGSGALDPFKARVLLTLLQRHGHGGDAVRLAFGAG